MVLHGSLRQRRRWSAASGTHRQRSSGARVAAAMHACAAAPARRQAVGLVLKPQPLAHGAGLARLHALLAGLAAAAALVGSGRLALRQACAAAAAAGRRQVQLRQ